MKINIKQVMINLIGLAFVGAFATSLTFGILHVIHDQMHVHHEEERTVFVGPSLEPHITNAEEMPYEHFHRLVPVREVEPERQSQCLMCHTIIPHNKNERIRALLNLHSDIVECESCHFKRSDQHLLKFEWFNYGIENEITAKLPYGVRYDEQTGLFAGGENYISKIVPYTMVQNEKKHLFMPQSHPDAREYLRTRGSLSEEEEKEATRKFHAMIEEKKAVKCEECHAPTGLLHFREMGFDEARTQELEQMSVLGMYTKYETFYLPNILLESGSDHE